MKRSVRDLVLEIVMRMEGSVNDNLGAGFHALPQS